MNIVSSNINGGARKAAEIHSANDSRNLELLSSNIFSLLLDSVAKALNKIFKLQGEDFIYPVHFVLLKNIFKSREPKEYHWVLIGNTVKGMSRDINLSESILYLHDEWYTTGWNCYTTDSNNFVYFPKVLVGVRVALRQWLKEKSQAKCKEVFGSVSMKSPSLWLANLAIARGFKCSHDLNQIELVKDDVGQIVRKNNNINIRNVTVVFAPNDNWYRKGSDLSFNYAVENHLVSKTVIIGGFMADQKIPNIEHIKSLSREDLLTLFLRTKTFIFLPRRDNLPNILIEAISCGVPNIVTNDNHGVDVPINSVIDI